MLDSSRADQINKRIEAAESVIGRKNKNSEYKKLIVWRIVVQAEIKYSSRWIPE